jgi:predicted ATP-grasp superfamily ATP-dependent carboligase
LCHELVRVGQALTTNIFIAGASARSAAFSALRAGLRPACADLFADADLQAVCPVARIPDDQYPCAIADFSEQFPPGPWMYTGGIENHLDVIRRVSEQRTLWGSPPEAVALARAPDCLRRLEMGMWSPGLKFPGDKLPPFEHWLLKPLAGAAGIGIRESFNSRPVRVPEGYYAQKYVSGLSCSALFVGHERGSVFLGATTQLVGAPWLNATGFLYAGSVGLLPISETYFQWFRGLGQDLACRLGLRGIYGVDCVLQPGQPYVIEINPRYTASVEVWEYARRRSVLALHRRAFEIKGDKAAEFKMQFLKISHRSRKIIGKAILYARDSVIIPELTPWSKLKPVDPASFAMPRYADLPRLGDRIEKGHPVLTFFATGDTTRDCIANLEDRAREIEAWLYGG